MATKIIEGKEILNKAMEYLIDLESGCFERLIMASKEIFNMEKDHLSDEMFALYLEFIGYFDRDKGDSHQDFIWKSLADMDDNKKREISFILLKLYTLSAEQSIIHMERKKIADKIIEFQKSLCKELL